VGHRGGYPNPAKRGRARALLNAGDPATALPLLAGSCFGAGYDSDYFELLGLALLGCGQAENAGRFLFLCGARRPEYAAAIALFLARHSDPRNFRQLQSRLPERIRVLWRLAQFPPAVAAELRALGWPEDTQEAIVAGKQAGRTAKWPRKSIDKIAPQKIFLFFLVVTVGTC
jgi:hypothetical protein